MIDPLIQEKAAQLTAMLSTPDLIEQAKSVPDVGVLEWLLIELEKRLPAEQFIAACQEIHAELA